MPRAEPPWHGVRSGRRHRAETGPRSGVDRIEWGRPLGTRYPPLTRRLSVSTKGKKRIAIGIGLALLAICVYGAVAGHRLRVPDELGV